MSLDGVPHNGPYRGRAKVREIAPGVTGRDFTELAPSDRKSAAKGRAKQSVAAKRVQVQRATKALKNRCAWCGQVGHNSSTCGL